MPGCSTSFKMPRCVGPTANRLRVDSSAAVVVAGRVLALIKPVSWNIA